jgi:hypothetical protein
MDLTQALEAYRSFSPAAWVGVYRILPTYAGILFVLGGLVLLLFGGGPAFRIVAVPLSATVGFLWGNLVLVRLGFNPNERVASIAFAISLGILGFALPQAALFFAVGIPIGMAVGQLAGQADWFLGFLPAFLLTGTLSAVFHRYLGTVASAVAGAWVLVIGMLAALHQVGGIVATVAQQPWGVILAAAFFATAGTIYQIAARPTPEELERLKQERQRARKRADEKKALEKRWANYSNDR